MNNQDKIKSALESIENGLAAINTDKDWIRYLTFCSSFYNYSYNIFSTKKKSLLKIRGGDEYGTSRRTTVQGTG
ncbi:MAG: hypothetical protein IKZ01_02865, partial [Anaerotignum sp.]|nr:hypothetical protein [Anaerotignum sp.]